MRTGKIVKKNDQDDHLDGDEWLQVFPAGTMEDLKITSRIPFRHMTYSKRPPAVDPKQPTRKVQSPLLVRRSYWETHIEGWNPTGYVVLEPANDLRATQTLGRAVDAA